MDNAILAKGRCSKTGKVWWSWRACGYFSGTFDTPEEARLDFKEWQKKISLLELVRELSDE